MARADDVPPAEHGGLFNSCSLAPTPRKGKGTPHMHTWTLCLVSHWYLEGSSQQSSKVDAVFGNDQNSTRLIEESFPEETYYPGVGKRMR